jgi:hypothetical protein
VRGRAWLWLALTAGLCSPLVVGRARASDKAAGLAKCGGSAPANVPQLTSYIDVRVPARYWIEVTWRDGEWQPADHLPMPHHHATRLELTNLAAFPALARHREGRVRLTIDVSSRETHKVPNRNEWRTTYTATIVAACAPPAPRP